MSLLDLFRRPPTPRKYASLLMKKLADHRPDEAVRFDGEGFRLLVGADGAQVINLHNLYHEYCTADRRERALQLERTVAILHPPGLPDSFAEVRTRLMPVLRARAMLEYLRLMERDKDPGTPSGSLALPFSSDTALMLVHDGDSMMQSFGPGQLEQWGVSVDEVLAAAMDNLRDASADRFVQVERGVFAGDWGDAYDSSRLLLPDLAHRIAGANPVAMIPARNTLLLASGNDHEGMQAMLALAQRIADTEPRPVSALMYRFENGRPVAHVPEDDALRAGLERLRRQYLFGDYASQKETLDALHEQDGTDIFVASYKVMRDAGGVEYSLCIWTRDVDTLLPRTDRVALSFDEGDPVIVPWGQLQAACGDAMEPVPEAYPERYRVRAYPARDRLPAAS